MIQKLFYIFILTSITSCTVSEEGIQTSQINADECEKSGGEFCSVEGTAVDLELIIKTVPPIRSASASGDCNGNANRTTNGDKPTVDNNIYCFDVSGDCNEGGLDTAAVVAKTSLDGLVSSNNLGSCKRGRFHVQLRVQLSPTNICRQHTLELELVGKKLDGTEVRQPAKAKKRIIFQADNNENC